MQDLGDDYPFALQQRCGQRRVVVLGLEQREENPLVQRASVLDALEQMMTVKLFKIKWVPPLIQSFEQMTPDLPE